MTRFTTTPTVVCLAAALCFLPACDGGGGDAWEGAVSDSAGVRVVSNTGGGVWGPDEGWTVEQDMVVGEAAGNPDYQFGQIAGIDVGSDGALYVLDRQAQEIRMYDAQGQFVRRIGGPGSGPGELSPSAGPLFVGPGDTLLVPDMALQRITRYGPEGEAVESRPLPMTEGIAVKWMEAPNQDLLQQAMIMAMPGQENVEPKNLVLRRAPSGVVRDTLMELPIGRSFSFSGGQPNITLFESEPTWSVGPAGRLYFGNSANYRVEARNPEGELTQIVQRPTEPQPVRESDQQVFRDILEDLWSEQGVPPQGVQAMSQSVQFAENYPAYANLFGGPAGTLWVQKLQSPDQVQDMGTFDLQDMGSADWEVFGRDGRLLGTVTMPPRFQPLMFQEDAIYGILQDEMDVQYAARLAIQKGSADSPAAGGAEAGA